MPRVLILWGVSLPFHGPGPLAQQKPGLPPFAHLCQHSFLNIHLCYFFFEPVITSVWFFHVLKSLAHVHFYICMRVKRVFFSFFQKYFWKMVRRYDQLFKGYNRMSQVYVLPIGAIKNYHKWGSPKVKMCVGGLASSMGSRRESIPCLLQFSNTADIPPLMGTWLQPLLTSSHCSYLPLNPSSTLPAPFL